MSEEPKELSCQEKVALAGKIVEVLAGLESNQAVDVLRVALSAFTCNENAVIRMVACRPFVSESITI